MFYLFVATLMDTHDAKVVIRKKKPILITKKEQQIVYKAIEELSDIKDFFIHTEQD